MTMLDNQTRPKGPKDIAIQMWHKLAFSGPFPSCRVVCNAICNCVVKGRPTHRPTRAIGVCTPAQSTGTAGHQATTPSKSGLDVPIEEESQLAGFSVS